MPIITATAHAALLRKVPPVLYPVGQHYPFYPGAFENYNLDGTKKTATEETTQVSSAGMLRAYGTDVVPAGFWPGAKPLGNPPTGMMVDEGQWQFDLTGYDNVSSIDPYTASQANKSAGYLYCMIYCDAHGDRDVYFAGRMFRQEPGSTV